MIVVDTGVLYAAADIKDHDHPASADLIETTSASELIVPATVVTETAYLVGSRLGAVDHCRRAISCLRTRTCV